MNTEQHFLNLRDAVASRNKRTLKAALEAFEDAQLLKDSIQADVLDVYKWLLSDPVALAAPGIDGVFLSFVGDIHKYSASNIQEIVKVVDGNLQGYAQQMLRHAAADFIARHYDPQGAFDFFKGWALRDEKYARHMALVGIEVLLMSQRAKKIGVEQEAKTIWTSLRGTDL